MYLIWQHGPLTVAEAHSMSADHSLTTIATFLKRLVAKGYLSTVLERSSPAGGRPPERFYPRVDYATGIELAVREFLADYLFGDPVGLSTSDGHHVFYRTANGSLEHKVHLDASGQLVTDNWGGTLAP